MAARLNKDLTALLSSKIEAFEDYYNATLLLGKTIEEKDLIKIESVVKLRENHIAKINGIDENINKITKESLPKDKIIDDLVVKMRAIIKKIQIPDGKYLAAAEMLLKENGKDMIYVGREINAFHGYTEKRTTGSRFLDIKT